MKSTYLCFDLGTSKIKTALFDDKGNILYFSQVGLDIHTRGNIIFQDPNECYGAVLKEIQIIKDKD
ncbi:MAG: hypothetical protein JW770_05295, partial [Actinobacteria bacterium]|nr:hypothetical protein [Actinomycetota bacterium]